MAESRSAPREPQGLSIVAHGESALDIRSPSPLSYLLPTAHGYSQQRTPQMTDCPHEHQPDTGFQTFRDIIREETDGGRGLVRFFTNAMSDERYTFKDEPWNYMYTVHGDTIKANTFASDGHDPFIYDSDLGRYVPADDKLRPFLADSMKHEWSPARVDLILNWYRDRSTRFWDPPPLDRVNVLNGILDIASGDFQPHSPDFLSPIQINAAWDPEAECPAIDRFVQRVFPYDAHEVFYQLAGLFLTPRLTPPESRPLPRLRRKRQERGHRPD